MGGARWGRGCHEAGGKTLQGTKKTIPSRSLRDSEGITGLEMKSLVWIPPNVFMLFLPGRFGETYFTR